MLLSIDLYKDILINLISALSVGATVFVTSSLFSSLRKSKRIQHKLENEAKQLIFDSETGEFIISKTISSDPSIENISKGGFASDGKTLQKENDGDIEIERPKAGGEKTQHLNIQQSYDFRHFQLIENHYSQALNQSRISFWFSLTGASIGFCVIILSIILYQEDRNGVALFSLISGVVIETVSVLFFTQTNRDQKRRSEFFENLRKDKQHKEALTLCETIQDPIAKDALKIQIALSFAGVQDATHVANSIIQDNLKKQVTITTKQ